MNVEPKRRATSSHFTSEGSGLTSVHQFDQIYSKHHRTRWPSQRPRILTLLKFAPHNGRIGEQHTGGGKERNQYSSSYGSQSVEFYRSITLYLAFDTHTTVCHISQHPDRVTADESRFFRCLCDMSIENRRTTSIRI